MNLTVSKNIVVSIASLGLLTGCLFDNQGLQSSEKYHEVDLSRIPPNPNSNTLGPDNGDIEVIANKKTATVVRGNRTLDTLVSCLGVGAASNSAKEEWQAQLGSLSVDGSPNSITAPMLVGFMKIASEVCSDLVQLERGMAANDRNIFNVVDFSQPQMSIDSYDVADVTRRLARSCWGRNETRTELQMIQTNINDSFSRAQNNNQETANKMIYLCTSVASSFATLSM